MVANPLNLEQELSSYLSRKSMAELRQTTRKHCRAYLEHKFNQSLSSQKHQIRAFLVQYVTAFHSKHKKLTMKATLVQSADERALLGKRKICAQSEEQPPIKKLKLTPKECDANETIRQPIDAHIFVRDESASHTTDTETLSLSPNATQKSQAPPPLEPADCAEPPVSVERMEVLTQMVLAENVLARLCKEPTTKGAKGANVLDCEVIELEAMKNKLTRSVAEYQRQKQLTKQYAALLKPTVEQSHELQRQNAILKQNIETLHSQHSLEIEKLTRALKNETSNVKEERFRCLRKDKYIGRLQRQLDFVCHKHNIDHDALVVEMRDLK